MPLYEYTARDGTGQLVRETLAFRSEDALRDYLRRNGLFVLDVSLRARDGWRPFQRRPGLGDLIVWTRQLRTMLRAGMPLVSGLEMLAEHAANRDLRRTLSEIERAVAQGHSLAATLAQYPRMFPELLVALVRSGEESGRLPEALHEAARQLERQLDIRQKLVSAMLYPCFTLIATVGAVLFMLLVIVPVFAGIYAELRAPLPPVTVALVSFSRFTIRNGWLFAVVLALAVTGLRRLIATPRGRLWWDSLKLRLPTAGGLIRKGASANFAGSLAGLLESGVPLLQSLETAAAVCGNEVLAQAVRTAAQQVATGRPLSEALDQSGEFPALVIRMVAVAERVGTLPEVLKELATAYLDDVEYTTRRLLVLVEPLMILGVAAIVGFVLLALYYPIFNLGNVMLREGG